MAQTPKRPTNCNNKPISEDITEYIADFSPLRSKCISLAYNEKNSELNRLRANIDSVNRIVANNGRYVNYVQRVARDASRPWEERNTALQAVRTALDTANENYLRTYNEYNAQIATLSPQISPSDLAVTCDARIRTAQSTQIDAARNLIAIPGQMCTQFDTAMATFETAWEGAFTALGLTVPA